MISIRYNTTGVRIGATYIPVRPLSPFPRIGPQKDMRTLSLKSPHHSAPLNMRPLLSRRHRCRWKD
jgi:hypothetical protein